MEKGVCIMAKKKSVFVIVYTNGVLTENQLVWRAGYFEDFDLAKAKAKELLEERFKYKADASVECPMGWANRNIIEEKFEVVQLNAK
jgi:hypothetical protein